MALCAVSLPTMPALPRTPAPTAAGSAVHFDTALTAAESAVHYDTALFGKRYRLDDSRGLASYIAVLDREVARSKREQPLGDAHEKDPLHNKRPRSFVEKKLRKAMEKTRE